MKVRTEARREAILEIASQVFLEFGFERASMAEIVRRIGGSKSTIYGYYPSKEALFQAVTKSAGEQHVRPAFDALAAHDISAGVYEVLCSFAETLAVFMCSEQIMATHRMVLAEAGHSNMGELFYEAGPKCGTTDLAAFFGRVMDQGSMRKADTVLAAQQFIALMQAEIQPRWYYRNLPPLTKAEIHACAHRAVDTFARAYELQRTAPQEPTDLPAVSQQGAESA
jgi:AcrR family transcriptional regulator